jgi:hypothetical protein
MDFPHDKHVWINQYMITSRSFCIDLNTIDLNELGAVLIAVSFIVHFNFLFHLILILKIVFNMETWLHLIKQYSF